MTDRRTFLQSIATLTMGGFLISGCDDMLLDLNATPQSIFTDKDIWGDIALARNYMNTVYQGLGQWGITSDNGPREMPNSATDEAMQRGDHGIWVLNQGNITASNYGTFEQWETDYQDIRVCNILLANIDKVPNGTADEKRLMKAQARFIRALNYFDLINWYSWWDGENNGVPIITEPFELGDEFQVGRNSYDEVVQFIIGELDAAEKVLPATWSSGDWGRVTKGAAWAVKSEVYLYAASPVHNPSMDPNRWQKAADAAEAVMQMGQYSLVQGISGLEGKNGGEEYNRKIFLENGNPEIILCRNYDPLTVDDLWVDKMNSPNGYLGWGGNCPTQQMVDKFAMANGKPITDPTSGYDPQDPYVNRELRFYANIVYNGRMYRGRPVECFVPGGRDSKDGPQGFNASPTGYTLYKFMDESVNFKVTNSFNPWIMFRLAEIYLNYAEAQYHLGNEGSAREYVNKIRRRVGFKETTSSGPQLLQDIMHERTIELAFEKDHRWCDVRRWGILPQTQEQDYISIVPHKQSDGSINYKQTVAMARSFHPRMYSLPIPIDEIQKTNLNQNPGY